MKVNTTKQLLCDENSDQEALATVTSSTLGVTIAIEGVRHCLGEDAIHLELRDGKLRVHVWADADQEDPTHSIEIPRG